MSEREDYRFRPAAFPEDRRLWWAAGLCAAAAAWLWIRWGFL